ncbi:MAG: protein phosphatase 2C domain-containing protein [Gemmatimonadaceae bacterium]
MKFARFASSFTTAASRAITPASLGPRPRDEELDLFGLTHPGWVRTENQDHFLLATVHPEVAIHGTSLPEPEGLALRGQRLATVLLVADGVGGRAAGSRASRLATEAVARYVTTTLRCYHQAGSTGEGEFLEALRAAAIDAHDAVRTEAQERPDERDMATTLSLGMVVWPWLYVVQVGDSRCYVYQDGTLRQVTRDQTVAQELVDRGVLSRETARTSPLSHVLSSAIGGTEALPEITRVDVRKRGCVVLVCTDGLTKHVSNAEIAEHLGAMESAERVCGSLLQLALDRGGTDNITLVVGRALRRAGG